jgi:Tol biopolymer transport system component
VTRALTTPPSGADVIGDFDAAYSPDGTSIAFVRAPAASSNLDIWTMSADGRDARRVTPGRWTHVHSLSWLDRSELLFTAGDLFSQRGYSVQVAEGTPYPLPGLGDNDRYANVQAGRLLHASYVMAPLRLWEVTARNAVERKDRDFALEGGKLLYTRDGERIAFIRGSGDGHVQIWMANRDGSDQRVLVDMKSAFDPEWDPDGRYLLFTSLDHGKWDVFMIDVEGGHIRRITANGADDQYPSFSHDGRWIYFSSNRSGAYEVYKLSVDAQSDDDAIKVTRGGGLAGVESFDGRYLFYELNQNGNPAIASSTPLWRVALDGSDEPRQVLDAWGPRADKGWRLTPNGIYFLVSRPDFIVRYLDLASSEITDVFHGSGGALYPSVSPDEQTLLVAKEPFRASELWLLENFRR